MIKSILTAAALTVAATSAFASGPTCDYVAYVDFKKERSYYDVLKVQDIVGADLDGKWGPGTQSAVDYYLYRCVKGAVPIQEQRGRQISSSPSQSSSQSDVEGLVLFGVLATMMHMATR